MVGGGVGKRRWGVCGSCCPMICGLNLRHNYTRCMATSSYWRCKNWKYIRFIGGVAAVETGNGGADPGPERDWADGPDAIRWGFS